MIGNDFVDPNEMVDQSVHADGPIIVESCAPKYPTVDAAMPAGGLAMLAAVPALVAMLRKARAPKAGAA